MNKEKSANRKKKMNTYVKYGLLMLVCTAGGGLLGFLSTFADTGSIGAGMNSIIQGIRGNILFLLTFFTLVSVFFQESIIKRMKKIGTRLDGAEDEEHDVLEYQFEKAGSAGVIGCTGFMILSILILATGYSAKYIDIMVKTERLLLLAGMIVFILENIYLGFWQVRYVKLIQKFYPEKKGDPSSLKFQEQWLESCDEAEKETIYQSSYKTYLMMNKLFPILAVIGMLGPLLWDTGIFAVVLVSIPWLASSVTYCRNCITKKGEKLR